MFAPATQTANAQSVTFGSIFSSFNFTCDEVIIMIIYKLKHEDYEKIKCILDGHFRPDNDGIMQQ